MNVKMSSTFVAQTAVLGALVVVFDYAMKFSGLKIPFPPLTYLKFDFTGIPVVLSLLLSGILSGATTSAVAVLAILARSGDAVSASMKGLAEFATVLGIYASYAIFKKSPKLAKPASFVTGSVARVAVMAITNLTVLPYYYGMTVEAVLLTTPLTAVFNFAQGFLSMFGGVLIYEALKLRIPSLITKKEA